ncbi:MAG: helix-hairpin-helix domain-containing protein [Candidatus Lindowbacteria bacterium]|nr:helix-hairpin-helix domain-containing protein [Candidatus Lindowbacteria bacterium]
MTALRTQVSMMDEALGKNDLEYKELQSKVVTAEKNKEKMKAEQKKQQVLVEKSRIEKKALQAEITSLTLKSKTFSSDLADLQQKNRALLEANADVKGRLLEEIDKKQTETKQSEFAQTEVTRLMKVDEEAGKALATFYIELGEVRQQIKRASAVLQGEQFSPDTGVNEAPSQNTVQTVRRISKELDGLGVEIGKLIDVVSLIFKDRNTLANELAANRKEIIEATRVINATEVALRKAYREREQLTALVGKQMIDANSSDTVWARITEYEREVTALRLVLSGAFDQTPTRLEIAPPVVVEPKREQPFKPVQTPSNGILDINTASLDQLANIPGLSLKRARAIIWYRDTVGQFNSVDDLKSVPGFNDEKIEAVREYVTVKEKRN